MFWILLVLLLVLPTLFGIPKAPCHFLHLQNGHSHTFKQFEIFLSFYSSISINIAEKIWSFPFAFPLDSWGVFSLVISLVNFYRCAKKNSTSFTIKKTVILTLYIDKVAMRLKIFLFNSNKVDQYITDSKHKCNSS